MPTTPLPSRRRRAAFVAAAGVSALVAIPSGAQAATTEQPDACDASALRTSLLGGAAASPLQANAAFTPCATDGGTPVNVPLGGLGQVNALQTSTAVEAGKVATARTQLASARIGLNDQLLAALSGPLTSSTGAVTQALGGALGGLSLPLGGTANVGSALATATANLPGVLAAALPDILNTGLVDATATATCKDGSAVLTGSSRIADLKVLGTSIDANAAADQLLSIDTTSINLGKLLTVDDVLKSITISSGPLSTVLGGSSTNLYALLNTRDPSVAGLVNTLLVTLTGQTTAQLLSSVTSQISSALNVPIQLPAGLLQAKLTPRGQSTSGGVLTPQTLGLSVSILSQPILSTTVAQARVGSGAPNCLPPTSPSPEANEILKCTKRPSTLIDVYGRGSRTYVQGVAQSRYVGRTATLYLAHGNRKVGTTKIRSNGLFSREVALPPKSIRGTNKARYYAKVGGRKTRELKFTRRMTTTSITSSGGAVRFKGRVERPLQARQRPILIQQRVTCTTYKTVKTVRPDAQGRFSATAKAPAGLAAGVYRAQTKVIKRVGSQKLFPTFTLPRVVGIR